MPPESTFCVTCQRAPGPMASSGNGADSCCMDCSSSPSASLPAAAALAPSGGLIPPPVIWPRGSMRYQPASPLACASDSLSDATCGSVPVASAEIELELQPRRAVGGDFGDRIRSVMRTGGTAAMGTCWPPIDSASCMFDVQRAEFAAAGLEAIAHRLARRGAGVQHLQGRLGAGGGTEAAPARRRART